MVEKTITGDDKPASEFTSKASSQERRPSWYVPAVLILLVLFAAQCLRLGKIQSATWDEPLHITAGYSYWANGDYRLSTSNLFLAQKFASWPLTLAHLNFPI